MIYRTTNTDCLNCGSQKPSRVNCIQDLANIFYRCPDCGHNIIRGVYREDGDSTPAHSTPPPDLMDEPGTIVPSDAYTTWEMWWTDRLHVIAINGKVVSGREEILSFVERLEEIYDSGETI